MAQALLEPFDLSGRLILADKGYDSDKFVHWIEERGGIVVIPSRICAKRPRNTDWHTYKERHLVENLFLKLKNYRRFATRYEKKALYFLSCGCLPCVYPCLVTLMVLKQTLGKKILQVDGLGQVLTELKAQGRNLKLVTGWNCTAQSVWTEIRPTKERFRKMDGRQYYHFV